MQSKVLKDAEIRIDNMIDQGVKLYTSKKNMLMVACCILGVVFFSTISAYVDTEIYRPIRVAMDEGLEASTMAHAVSLGVCSGLSAPGFTMIFLFVMTRVLTLINIHLGPSTIAISAAINAALVIPDLFVWKNVYASVGSRFVSGGKYIRPFVGGVVPWALSTPFLYLFIFYLVHFLSVLISVST